MNVLTTELVKLTEQPYDAYNAILPLIKQKLGNERVSVFEHTLMEELPLTTARRAYRTAIQVAMGEKAYRETEHQKPEQHEKKPKKIKK
jgi:hypothetical protein